MRILVLQHAATEHPGTFRDFMRADDIAWDTVELDRGGEIPVLAGYDALLVLGGPMDVWQEDLHPWMIEEKRVIRDWVRADRPFLGICLGHQLLAEAMGGEVSLMRQPEVGVCDISLTPAGRDSRLFAGTADVFPALQWHGAAITRLPAGARVLAENIHCAIQSIQVGERAFGIQYHVELTESTVRDWGAIPEYRCALESITGPDGQALLEAAATQHMAVLHKAAAQLYGNFRAVMREWSAANASVC